jgi:hypothetical protein
MAELLDPGNRSTPLASWALRVSIAVGGLAVCSGCIEVRVVGGDASASIPLLALFALAVLLLLVFAGLAVLVGRRPSRRRLLKVLVATVAGGVCGTLWVLFIVTIRAAERPAALTDLPLVGVGVVVAVSAAVLLSGRGRLREVVGRSLMATGFNSLALPIAALISFLLGGAQLSPGSARPELSAVILGVRLAGNVTTAGLSVGGLLTGVFLVFLGDRLLRQVRQAQRGRADSTRFIRGPFRHP